ncbi:hypothetical protein KHA80_11730 [Anaerobacillus sp. HL2]|nr:hypothetical protein KHA80_11730 [Anaerobacillus sp. HL2]
MKEAFRKVVDLNENIKPAITSTVLASIAGTTTKTVTVKLTFSENVSNADATNDFEVLVDGTATGTVASQSNSCCNADKEVTVTFDISEANFGKKVELRAKSTIDIQDAKNKVADNTVVLIKN